MSSKPLYRRAFALAKSKGITELVKRSIPALHRIFIRPHLPVTSTITYNDVKVQYQHLGDAVVPWKTPPYPDRPRYEDAIVTGLRSHVTRGSDIIIVGGGWGVSTTIAALQTGSTGSVVTYEGAKSKVEDLQNTIHLNGVSERVSVSHAIVGKGIALNGDAENAKVLSPKNLPDCDVLVLDCEGAELIILEDLQKKPQVIIVETHAFLGSPEKEVEELLTRSGYEIISKDVADPNKQAFCEEKGIYVLVAVLDD